MSNPWVILNSVEQSIKEKIENYGVELGKWPEIKINYGIKTGYNDAFIINEETRNTIISSCGSSAEREMTANLIRPILRGRDIKRNSYTWAGYYIILTYFDSHKFLKEKCPSIFKYLSRFESQLKNRGQCRYLSNGKTRKPSDADYPGSPGMPHWWELDNCPSSKYLDVFDNRIIAWQRITQENCFCITQKGMLVLDSMAFISVPEKMLNNLCIILNSKLFYYWMRKNVHEYGESGFRLSNQFVEIFPAVLDAVDNDEDIYKKYHLTAEEIYIVENTK